MQLVSGMKRGIKKSLAALVLICDCVARLLDLLAGERGAIGQRHGYHKPALADKRDRDWCGFDLDATVTPADIEGHSRLQSSLTADLFRDDQASCRIYGGFHTMKDTTGAGT